MTNLRKSIKSLGDGEIVKLDSDNVFKLDSYHKNPIIKPKDLGLIWHDHNKVRVGAVFNGGAEIFGNNIIIAPRCHKNYTRHKYFDKSLGIERYYMKNYISKVWILRSRDGIHFKKLENTTIKGDGSKHKDFVYGIEDIRITRIEDNYFLVGCGKIKPPFKEGNADSIAIYTTKNFKEIRYCGIVDQFYSKDTIPFPEKIDNKLYMLFRFHPNIHLDLLKAGMEQLTNPAKYRSYWHEIYENRKKNLLISAGNLPHEIEKIGLGPQIIKTKIGWLMIYHAVGEIGEEIRKAYGLKGKVARGYSICATILDSENPLKVIYKTKHPIYIPNKAWELSGNRKYPVDVPFVIFPMGAITKDDKLLLYCGAGDKYVVLLSCRLSSLLRYLVDCSS